MGVAPDIVMYCLSNGGQSQKFLLFTFRSCEKNFQDVLPMGVLFTIEAYIEYL